MNWYLAALKKYAVFSGRARRTEFWMFQLFDVLILGAFFLVAYIAGHIGGIGKDNPLAILFSISLWVYWFGLILPRIAVTVRRFHDTGHSGWWILVTGVPVIGLIFWFVSMVTDGTPGENKYGPNPKD